MKSFAAFSIFIVFGVFSCKQSQTPRLPPAPVPDNTIREALLVWTVPVGEFEGPGTDPPTGVRETPLSAKTYWVTHEGGYWRIYTVRQGVIISQGDTLAKLVKTCFHHRIEWFPEPSPNEHECITQCRERYEIPPTGGLYDPFIAKGCGLSSHQLDSTETFVIRATPASMAELDYDPNHLMEFELLGGLGSMLFVHFKGFECGCCNPNRNIDGIQIADVSRQLLRTEELFGTSDFDRKLDPNRGKWDHFLNKPETRKEVWPQLHRDIQATAEEDGIDPAIFEEKDMTLIRIFPEFVTKTGTFVMRLIFSYYIPEKFQRTIFYGEKSTITDRLPPELQEYSGPIPAAKIVQAQLPAGWRIGGLSRVRVSAGKYEKLLAMFTTEHR
jgi:hypothetical protein